MKLLTEVISLVLLAHYLLLVQFSNKEVCILNYYLNYNI